MSPKRRNEKIARDAWTPERRKAESDKRKVRQAKARAREKAARALRSATPPPPPPVEPRRTLVRDDRPDVANGRNLVQRRRASCSHLVACEDAWIAVYGGDPARCPSICDGYERRADTVRLVSIGRAFSLG